MEETEGLEPSTLSFEAKRSNSIELRLRNLIEFVKSAPGRIRTFTAPNERQFYRLPVFTNRRPVRKYGYSIVKHRKKGAATHDSQ